LNKEEVLINRQLIALHHPCLPSGRLVDQILAAKQQPPLSPFDKGELRDADTSALERQIDVMVYKLYGLTYEEVKIIESEFTMSAVGYEAFEIGQ